MEEMKEGFSGVVCSAEIRIDRPDYMVVCGSALRIKELRSKVVPLLEAGYQLVGGVVPDGQGRLYQTLLRRTGR